ncbi:hypothetical protein HY994_06065 [Candidatus Micrarchaeota archaeon]|nr:hypothetical protein [Candidatus Micrarchaeota archaeon]
MAAKNKAKHAKREKSQKNANAAKSTSSAKPAHSGLDNRLDRIEKQLDLMQADARHMAEFDTRTETIVERKVYEIKAISYITLIIASVLLALMLGMVLNALGIKIV